MTLEEFHSNQDWRHTFDVAFGLGTRDTLAPDYCGPVLSVVRVFCCNRGGDGPRSQYSFACVEFEDAPHPYALVYSYREGGDWVGGVVYYDNPPLTFGSFQ